MQEEKDVVMKVNENQLILNFCEITASVLFSLELPVEILQILFF